LPLNPSNISMTRNVSRINTTPVELMINLNQIMEKLFKVVSTDKGEECLVKC
jgi:hypothetical protein